MVALAVWSSAVVADDRYDDYKIEERFKLRIGSFVINSFDTTARFDSTRYPIGSLIDLEEDFNLDTSETVLRIDGFYRFNNRHRIDWTYYHSEREGSAVTDREFIIGDPDDPEGGFVIPKSARVDTKWSYDLLKVGYAWSFLHKRRYEMFIGAGLNLRQLDIEIAYDASLGNLDNRDSFEGDGLVPLPTASIGGRWNLTDKWQSIFKYETFLLEVGNYKGSQQDFQLLFEHSTFKHTGFGMGVNAVDINLRASDDDIRGEFDSRVFGLIAYVKFFM